MNIKSDKLYWFVAIVTPNTEKKAMENLNYLIGDWKKEGVIDDSESITPYVPIQEEWRIRRSTGKRVKVMKVLTSCYLFIQCRPFIRYKLACEAKFILHFMMNPALKDDSGKRDFARIPNEQMERFIRMVSGAEGEVTIDPSRLRIGSKVRIKSGSLAGLEGNIYQAPKGVTMLALRVDFLGYAKMKVPLSQLEFVEEKDQDR